MARARRAGFPIAATYGLTEAASQVATQRPGACDVGLVPLPGTRVRVVTADGSAAAPGDLGEILVRGPGVMRGYWRRPEDSASALRDGWLHTGDLGRLAPSGCIEVLARRSDLIISGGENVVPAEVEAVLLAHPLVREAAVAGVPDAEFGARPAAWIVADEPLPSAQLRAFCREHLAGFKIPVAFHRVALP